MRVQRILQEINGSDNESPGEQQNQGYRHQGHEHANPASTHTQPPPHYNMYQPPHAPPQQPLMGPGMVPYDLLLQQQQEEQQRILWSQQQEAAAQGQGQGQEQKQPAKKNIWARITDALKLPFVVACVFFILTLPVVDNYLSKYAPWTFSSGGQLSMPGIAVKSVIAGTIMGIYDTIDSLVSRFL
jgi:hypothetical protein